MRRTLARQDGIRLRHRRVAFGVEWTLIGIG